MAYPNRTHLGSNPHGSLKQHKLTKKKLPATQKIKYFLYGGPYAGGFAWLSSPFTYPFTAKGMTGRYRLGKALFTEDKEPELIPLPLDNYEAHDLIWEKTNVHK